MADDNVVELCKRAEKRFSARSQLDSFRQEVALNFCPWHASFTTDLTWGEDFAAHLADGTPILLGRDFIGQIGAMLRPPGKQWFWHRTALDDTNNDVASRTYLDRRSTQMMRIMHDRITGFSRATKQTDEFFGFFGDAVMSIDLGRDQVTLRFASYHIKDCVWAVGHENRVDTITRREKMTARNMRARFGEKALHEKVKEACEKDPDIEFEVHHHVLPADEYDYYKQGLKRQAGQFASIWTDAQHKTVLRETTQKTLRYVVPRWVTLPHMPYAISPATTIALPDARLIQQQAVAILEAAEKQINPPLVAYGEAVRGDVSLVAGGLTYLDKMIAGKVGDEISPLELGKNFGLGVDSLMRTQEQLARAFYLDVLRMPDTRRTKATVEVQFMIDEYVRAALPLFAPMQAEYNDAILYEADALIEMAGGYRDLDQTKPQSLKGQPLQFLWDNPLSDMIERAKAQTVAEVSQIGQTIAALEMAAAQAPSLKQADPKKMFRDAASAVGAAPWLMTEEQAAEAEEAAAQAAQMQQMVASAPNIAQVIDSGVNAAKTAAEIPNPAEPGIPLLPAPTQEMAW